MPAVSPPTDNHVLGALSHDVQERLFPHLRSVPLTMRSVLHDPQHPTEAIFFPTDALISIQYLSEDGATTTLSVVGNEGLVGFNLFKTETSLTRRAVVQSAGHSYRLPDVEFRKEFGRHGELMSLVMRHTQASMSHIAQTAVCNRHHRATQQLSRLLLTSLDRVPHNRVKMTQESISNVLGVRRESVSSAASELQSSGAIKYSRGLIEVVDRSKLEDLACECYEVIKTETESLLDDIPQRQVTWPKLIPERHLKICR